MANPRRGEAGLTLAGRSFTLRLTLNALAEMEGSFGVEGLAALGERLAAGSLRSSDLVALLGAAMRGGGAALSDEAVGDLVEAGDLPAVAEALGRVFAATFGRESPDRPRRARR